MTPQEPFTAIGIDMAFDLTRALYDNGYPYLGITMHTGGRYAYIELWDADSEIARVIVCTDKRWDDKAQEFLDFYMSEHDNNDENPCGLVGHISQPSADNPKAFVLTKWIWRHEE
jgi:hypothetical protein